MLQINTKHVLSGDTLRCTSAASLITLERRLPVDFKVQTAAASADYLNVQLGADSGPSPRATTACSCKPRRSTAARRLSAPALFVCDRLAGQAGDAGHLATAGASKVGFTRTANPASSGHAWCIERNTMRYYLAIDSYLRHWPPPQRSSAHAGCKLFSATEHTHGNCTNSVAPNTSR